MTRAEFQARLAASRKKVQQSSNDVQQPPKPNPKHQQLENPPQHSVGRRSSRVMALPDGAAVQGHGESLLAYFMNDAKGCERLLHRTSPAIFSSPHDDIIEAIHDLYDEREKVNLLTVSDRLSEKRLLDKCGGRPGITDIANATTSAEIAESALDWLLDAYRERQAPKIGKQLQNGEIDRVEAEMKLAVLNRSTGAVEPSAFKRTPLTIRTIDEILGMKFDEADLILQNGYLTLGDATAMCGPGGIGKTRLTMQLAMCCRAGRDFLDWPTNGRELRFLFLQTENSSRRLQADLEKMLSVFKPEEQQHVKAGLFFHVLEQDEDGFLALDFENQKRIEKAITETGSHVVICDPLRDFSLDDLNSDKVMDETVRDLCRAIKRGNPKRLPLLVHHAATGKAGAQKATGWDRASFGRNSKVLHSKVRAMINAGQAQPDENSVIIIASGKANNAPEFAAFAIRLNFDTLHYARDHDFDMEGWHEEISSGGRKGGARATPGTEDDFYDLTPPVGSIDKNLLLQNAGDESRGDKRIGDKRARVYLTSLIDKGRLFVWRVPRPKTNPRIEISRHEQTLI